MDLSFLHDNAARTRTSLSCNLSVVSTVKSDIKTGSITRGSTLSDWNETCAPILSHGRSQALKTEARPQTTALTAFGTAVAIISLIAFPSASHADDVNITTNTNNGINLDGYVGTTVGVSPGVAVTNTTATLTCSSFASLCATTHAWTLTNQGTIGPGNSGDGVKFKAGGSVINMGAIDGGNLGNGIWVEGAPGTVDNRAGATIHGTNGGVVFKIGGPAGTVTNAGTITAESLGAAVSLGGGGIFTNLAGGVVQSHGGSNAVSIILGTSRTVINSGLIKSNDSGFATGVAIQNGVLTNNAGGQILGAYNGVWANGSSATSITNAGLIEASKAQGGGSAIEVDGGGTVVNSGTIRSLTSNGATTDAGISFTGAGTITNSGTIASATGGLAIRFKGSATHNLTLDTGSILGGNVQGGTGTDSLTLQGTSTESVAKFLSFENLSMQGSDWTLTGNGTFATATTVQAGILRVNGQLTSPSVAVASGGTLTGAGTIVGAVTVADGGTLSGRNGQTLTMSSLALDRGSIVAAALGAPGTTGLFNITGNLTLAGTLNVTNAGGYSSGVYRLFDYGGTLTDYGLAVGFIPGGTRGMVQTAVANQVNLVVNPGAVQFWNGTTTAPTGAIVGGPGTWTAGPLTNWTDANGSYSDRWGGQFAVFQGARGGTNGPVQVDAGAGAVSATGMQFIGTGWSVRGDPITLAGTGGATVIRVGDGSPASASDVANIGSVLTGSSRLVKDDLGTLILQGANAYTGGTVINAGTLQLGSGTSGSIAGNVANNGTLAFNRSDAVTFGGAISGNGSVQQNGSGTTTLTATNTYAGGTAINAGTLQLGSGGTSGSIAGNVANNGTLAFNRSDAVTFGGAISGSGSVQQNGSGTAILTATNTYIGDTVINAGSLIVNGSIANSSMTIVNAGATLGGAGTVGETMVNGGGTIAPGNSIGTLNISGNIAFARGSIYQVEANAASQADKVVATGTATINGGTVQVLAGAGNYAPATTYTILTANGGRSGSFSSVTSNFAFLNPSLTYDPNNVYLTLTRNSIDFAAIGGTRNQRAAGGGVETLGWGHPIYNAVLQLDASPARAAFDAVSGEIHASAKTALIEDSRFVRNAAIDRIRTAFDAVGAVSTPVMAYADDKSVPALATADRLAVWGQGFGSWGQTDSDGNAARVSRSTGGFLIGGDALVFDNWRLGLLGGYSRTDFDVNDRRSSGVSDDYHLGLYGGTQWGALAFRTGLAHTWHDISINRNVAFPGFADSVRSDYKAGTTQVFGELGYGIKAGRFGFEPFANLAYVNLHTDGFREKGGAATLSSAGTTTDTTFSTLGLRASTDFELGGMIATAKGTLGWRHAFGDTTPLAAFEFAGGNAFTIAGAPIARDAAVVEAGLDLAIGPAAALGVFYSGQFASRASDQSIHANFSVKF
jgi:fibronectin-binding autotransporter adhesin